MLKVGVIGCGYWGPNLVRVFDSLAETRVLYACDLAEEKLKHINELYPHIKTTTDYRDILNNPAVNAVAVATQVPSHYSIVMEALRAGKHVFVEKPVAGNSAQALEMIHLAEERKLTLMVGHIFEYTAAVAKIKEMVDAGELGDIYYISCQRLNLGIIQRDINVLWDLASHDISVILSLLKKEPVDVSATGACHFTPGIEDVAVMSMKFENNLIAYVHTSWLDPNKTRQMTIVGSKKMLVFDDVEPIEKIKIFHKGVNEPEPYDTFGEFPFTYRYGDIEIPMLKSTEPLKTELAHFRDCVLKGLKPQTDGYSGLRVIKILEQTMVKK